jgi:uncharacterized protein YndB with AHSA1/START domain
MEIDRSRAGVGRTGCGGRSPDTVWKVLTTVEEIPRWFSQGVAVEISGPVAPGASLRMKGRGTGWISATIEAVDPPHILAWTSRTFGIATTSTWRLDPSAGGTRVAKGESMSGVPARLMRGTLQKKVGVFMEAWLRDLKVEAERRVP